MEKAEKLKIDDHIDHRDFIGSFIQAKIIGKDDTKLKIHYIGWDTKWDVWSDYTVELHRFALFKSISKRKPTRFPNIKFKLGDFVDINPYASLKKGWRKGRIVKIRSCQIKVSFWGLRNKRCQKLLIWTHMDNCKEFDIYLTHTKNRIIDTVPDWIKTHQISESIPNEIMNKCGNKIINSLFGGMKHLIHFIVDNSDQTHLRKINQIVNKQIIKYKDKQNIACAVIGDNDLDVQLQPKSIGDIQNDLLSIICGFLERNDLDKFKLTSRKHFRISFEEITKHDILLFNTNLIIENINKFNNKYLDLKRFDVSNLMNIHRYNPETKHLKMFFDWELKYNISMKYQLLIPNKYHMPFNYSKLKSKSIQYFKWFEREYILFDKRNTIMFNNENKTNIMTQNDVQNDKNKFIILKWFDIFHQKLKIIQFLYVNPDIITCDIIFEYFKSSFISTTNDQSKWYKQKVKSYLLEMNDTISNRTKLLIYKEIYHEIQLIDDDTINQRCFDSHDNRMVIFILQINHNHPLWSSSKFCSLEEKYLMIH